MNSPPSAARLSRFSQFYRQMVLQGRMPRVVIAVFVTLALYFGYHIRYFQIDATEDSVVLRDDPALRYYDKTRLMFGTDDYGAIVLQADSIETLLSDRYLTVIGDLETEIGAMENVLSTFSILQAPLFHSPNIPLMMLTRGYNTLLGQDKKTGAVILDPAKSTDAVRIGDRTLAGQELVDSPLMRDFLIGSDGTTTAIQVNFDPDLDFLKLEVERGALSEKAEAGEATREELRRIDELNHLWEQRHFELSGERRADIEEIRGIIDRMHAKYPFLLETARIEQSGVPMVIVDMINYVESDIKVFGSAVLLFMMVVLALIFRRIKWVALPLVTCLIVGAIMLGFLGWSVWQTTLVSNNMTPLLLILTMSMTIHLIVRYRELHAANPQAGPEWLSMESVRLIAPPCLFMALTSMIGFASLWASAIPPVIDFGLMMTLGLAIAYVTVFVFFPATLTLARPESAPDQSLAELEGDSIFLRVARFTLRQPVLIFLISVSVLIVASIGIGRLSVEARFLDYFREGTPINASMTLIDERLGGTMPLEVVIDGGSEGFWLENDNLKILAEIHRFIDDLPATGKVISLDSLNRILTRVNNNRPINKMIINQAMAALPDHLKGNILDPYVAENFRQARITIRVRESDKKLQRIELRQQIENYLRTYKGMELRLDDNAHVTGYFVLYNNTIQSLFKSQLLTIGIVVFATWIMFILLFRSVRVASIMIVPNIFPVVAVLGTMGWLDIKLDMMTIMIAAVTFGIAVDDTIHYTHRFRQEFREIGNYRQAMFRSHNSIGRAIAITSATIIAGFSILSLSNFVPTVYFGCFTGLAMLIAFFTDMTILPLLLCSLKPFGEESDIIPLESGAGL